MIRQIKPNTEPFGFIIALDIFWARKPVETFNYKTKRWEWAADRIDEDHYIEFINGHYKEIPRGCCRICEKQIQPYSTKYFQKHYDNGSKYSFLYDAEHFYCEECAKAQASKSYFNDTLPAEIERFETKRDGETVEVRVYADGSRIEEMTSRERAKAIPAFD